MYRPAALMSVALAMIHASAVQAEPLLIIGAGFPRTGTISLKLALQHLGYKVYHMSEISENHRAEDFAIWNQRFGSAQRPMKDLVHSLYEQHNYTVAVDFPTSAVWKELAEIYPNAKIILTERTSPELWWESASKTVIVPFIAFRILYEISPFFRKMKVMIVNLWQFAFDLEKPRLPEKKDKNLLINAYVRNSERVRHYEDQSRVLIFDARQGWAPLCAFLDIATVPKIPYPHTNKRSDVYAFFIKRLVKLVVPPVLLLLAAAYLGKVDTFRSFTAKPEKKE